jgi:hypothetical protein
MSIPTAPTPDQCRCKVVDWTRDPAEPHIPAQPEWEQADDCPVHPLTAAPAPNAADEREAIVEVAAEVIHNLPLCPHAYDGWSCDECVARAVLDAVADRLVAPLKTRLAEVETADVERGKWCSDLVGASEANNRILLARAERAEAALAAAEQRGAVKALREAAEAADRSVVTGLEKTRPDRVARWLRARADRLTTQATNEEEG